MSTRKRAGKANEVLGEDERLQPGAEIVIGPIRAQLSHHSAIDHTAPRVFATARCQSFTAITWSHGDNLAALRDDCACDTRLTIRSDFSIVDNKHAKEHGHLRTYGEWGHWAFGRIDGVRLL